VSRLHRLHQQIIVTLQVGCSFPFPTFINLSSLPGAKRHVTAITVQPMAGSLVLAKPPELPPAGTPPDLLTSSARGRGSGHPLCGQRASRLQRLRRSPSRLVSVERERASNPGHVSTVSWNDTHLLGTLNARIESEMTR